MGWSRAYLDRSLSRKPSFTEAFLLPALLLVVTLQAGSAAPADTTLATLQAEIAALAAGVEGDVGAAIIHIESGRGVATRGEVPFFLASVYKLPIAIALLRRVDAGTLDLADTVRLAPWDFRLGRSTLAPNGPGGSGAYTLGRLLDAMISDSDNSASDAVLRQAGGPAAVTDTLEALGLDGIRIDRSEGETLLEFYAIEDSLPREELVPSRLQARVRAATPGALEAAAARFGERPRDTGTALAVAELLERLWKGELVSASGTRLLLELLRNGWIETRIRAGIPPGTPVWHKTGTYGAAAIHDAGIVELPDGTHLIVVALARQPRRDTEAMERAIASITQTAYEFWSRSPATRS